ncbi:hypothetical protein F7725_017681 [Dissostichus mawsoni]|uniref:Uncharacterized protein n=1 Tax=Dissostichus mawsoni TaxID=36200 RepID=A0A7J5XPD9_DISMA|nr:hypothetical protein F7725_017681 [Dissostichus mawsoni]
MAAGAGTGAGTMAAGAGTGILALHLPVNFWRIRGPPKARPDPRKGLEACDKLSGLLVKKPFKWIDDNAKEREVNHVHHYVSECDLQRLQDAQAFISDVDDRQQAVQEQRCGAKSWDRPVQKLRLLSHDEHQASRSTLEQTWTRTPEAVDTQETSYYNKPSLACVLTDRARRRQRRQQPSSDSQQAAMGSELVSQVSSVQAGARPGRRHGSGSIYAPTSHGCVNRPAPIRLEHHIFSKGEWRRARLSDHPRALITISMDMPVGLRDGTSNRGSADGARISAVADKGAQLDLWSLEEFLACGFVRDDLRPVSLSLSAANRSPIAIEGAFFARLSTTCGGGRVTSCRSMVYVSSSVRAMYLSYESLLNLSLLPVNFPSDDVAGGPKDRRSPDTADTPDQPLSVNATRSTNGGCVGPAETS